MSTPVCPSAPKPSALLTPVTRGGIADYVALRTPLRGNQELITRTPTPFKDALAEMEKKGGPINYIVIVGFHSLLSEFCIMFPITFSQLNTPTRFDDLNDIIGKDTDQSDSALHTPNQVNIGRKIISVVYLPSVFLLPFLQNLHQDSGYLTDKRQTTGGSSAPSVSTSTSATGKENVPGSIVSTSNGPTHKSPNRRARKALHATWSTPGNIQVPGIGCDSLSFLPETPVRIQSLPDHSLKLNPNECIFHSQSKSLIGDSSVLFSPPSIIRETLPETQDGEDAYGHPPHRPNSSIESSGSRSPSEKVCPLEQNWR